MKETEIKGMQTMKLAIAFHVHPHAPTPVFFSNQLLHQSESQSDTSFLFFEYPINGREVIYVAHSVKVPSVSMGVWFLNKADIERMNQGWLMLADSPPRIKELQLRYAKKVMRPVVAAFKEGRTRNPKLSYNRFVDIWINFPDVFWSCIAKRKGPSLLTQQNFFTLLMWEMWNRKDLTMAERVAEIEAAGYGGGKLNDANLCARTEELGLS